MARTELLVSEVFRSEDIQGRREELRLLLEQYLLRTMGRRNSDDGDSGPL